MCAHDVCVLVDRCHHVLFVMEAQSIQRIMFALMKAIPEYWKACAFCLHCDLSVLVCEHLEVWDGSL